MSSITSITTILPKLRNWPWPSIMIGVSLSWWIYLALITQMVIVQDAIGYRDYGELLLEDGWREYFRTGPNREPLYPFLIYLSMKLGLIFKVPYDAVLKTSQILILLLTQILLGGLLTQLKIKTPIKAWLLLCFGFSPSIVNAALSHYSEIAAFPWLPAILIVSAKLWLYFQNPPVTWIPTARLALGLAFLFLGLTLVKGIFEPLVFLYGLPYLILIFKGPHQKEKILFARGIVCLTVFSVVYFGGIHFYKLQNKIHNGNYTLTNRGGFALYGNTARRLEPLTKNRFLAALAFVPGEDVCRALLPSADCDYWSYLKSDQLAQRQTQRLVEEGQSGRQLDNSLIRLSFKEIFRNPFQYGLFYLLEAGKTFFYESTRIGFVVYPDWLERIYNSKIFQFLLRLISSILVGLASISAVLWVLRNFNRFFSGASKPDNLLFWTVWLVLIFVGLSSLFLILARYLLPIVPLFIVLGAVFLNQRLNLKEGKAAG